MYDLFSELLRGCLKINKLAIFAETGRFSALPLAAEIVGCVTVDDGHHESLIHFLAVAEFTGTHHTVEIATRAQLKHQIGRIRHCCHPVSVKFQPFDMVLQKFHRLTVEFHASEHFPEKPATALI